MKYLKRLKSESEYNAFLGGGEYIEPHIVTVESDNTDVSVKFKAKKSVQKIVNYISYTINSSTSITLNADYPVATKLYGLFSNQERLCLTIGEKTVKWDAPIIGTITLTGICFALSSGDGPNLDWQQECEDDTYIYRIKNE